MIKTWVPTTSLDMAGLVWDLKWVAVHKVSQAWALAMLEWGHKDKASLVSQVQANQVLDSLEWVSPEWDSQGWDSQVWVVTWVTTQT